MVVNKKNKLLKQLPTVRGEYISNAPLNRVTWLRVGGPAEIMFHPHDEDDLKHFLKNKPQEIPVTVFGSGSNILVRDGGIRGVVIRLGANFRKKYIKWEENIGSLYVGAGAIDITVSRYCRDSGLAGFEFLSGVPGTIGGALKMNAGAYGNEMSKVTMQANVIDHKGDRVTLTSKEMGFSYRNSAIPDNWIFISAILRGFKDLPKNIKQRMKDIELDRKHNQPLGVRTGGSTFINPIGKKAWQLIDEAGCRGLKNHEAMVSEKHCNFLVNTGGANATSIEELGEEVRVRVQQSSGIKLKWEIHRLGQKAVSDTKNYCGKPLP